MRLATLILAFLALTTFTSCDKTLEENSMIDNVEKVESSFFFAPEIKDGQVNSGYELEATLEKVSSEANFYIKWGNANEYYSFEFIPAESEVRFLKFFEGKDCREIMEFNMLERSNTLQFHAKEDQDGKIEVSLGNELLFENTEVNFKPTVGKYRGLGGLSINNFKLR